MIYVQIAESLEDHDFSSLNAEALLETAARQVIQLAGEGPHQDVTLVLTGDAQMQELNRQFMGIDAPTDVLAFPAGETDPDSQHVYLGDVIISYPRAQAQAEIGKHPVGAELQLLAVHGMLHLLGHDHATPEEKSAMWATQSEALTRLGLSIQP